MTRTRQRRLASVRVRIAHMCFVSRFRGINGTPWQSWGSTGGVQMSVTDVGEVEGGDETAAVTPAVPADTAAALVHYYPVAPGVELRVRSGPGTTYGTVRTLAEGAKVPIYCQTPGQTITGPYGTSKI